DGSIYRDHSPATTVVRSHGDTVLGRTSYAIDVRHVALDGRPVVHVTLGPLVGEPDPNVRITAILDPRTTLPLRYEAHTPTGAAIDLAFSGTHVTGTRRGGADSTTETVDVTLSEPAFLGAYEDAALDALPLRIGMVARVPVLSISVGGLGEVKPYCYRV